jgi:MEDS: MEthanogen/methylotroph, DcmR Sensory domain
LSRSIPNWLVGSRGHAVQFYENDRALARRLSNYIGTALVTGGTAIVIATREHLAALSSSLALRGLDVSVARKQDRYLEFDAAQTLHSFFSHNRIDRSAFQGVVAQIMSRALARSVEECPHVSAFGEMVMLLWQAGHRQAAIELEELWNEMLETHELSLCCAYPMKLFVRQDDAASFLRICAQHSHIFPADAESTRRHAP